MRYVRANRVQTEALHNIDELKNVHNGIMTNFGINSCLVQLSTRHFETFPKDCLLLVNSYLLHYLSVDGDRRFLLSSFITLSTLLSLLFLLMLLKIAAANLLLSSLFNEVINALYWFCCSLSSQSSLLTGCTSDTPAVGDVTGNIHVAWTFTTLPTANINNSSFEQFFQPFMIPTVYQALTCTFSR